MSQGQAAKRAKATGSPIDIMVTYDHVLKSITVDEPVFWIHKGNCEQVHWSARNKDGSLPDPEFTVHFGKNGCPFHYEVFNNTMPFSGLVRRDVLPDKHRLYEYSIQIEDVVLDPRGGVQE